MKVKGRCSQPGCLAPDGVCNEGYELNECPNFAAITKNSKTAVGERKNGADSLVNWTGRSLGLDDLAAVTARNQPRVVGVVGPSDAGKTTILGMLYNFLHQGWVIGGWRFAGSLSVEGWQNIFGYMQWNKGLPPGFPPHTEANTGRGSGLLHLAFRGGTEDRLKDYLLTDAPGEWFKRWALNADAEDAEGARWIAQYGDAFVFVIDCKALAGEERGQARVSYDRLINRLGDELNGRPLAVVWSKIDYEIDERIREAIWRQLDKVLPGYTEFRVSVKQEAGANRPTIAEFAGLFEWMLTARRTTKPIMPPERAGDDLMLAFRG